MEIDETKLFDAIKYLCNPKKRQGLKPEDLPVIENIRTFIQAIWWVLGVTL